MCGIFWQGLVGHFVDNRWNAGRLCSRSNPDMIGSANADQMSFLLRDYICPRKTQEENLCAKIIQTNFLSSFILQKKNTIKTTKQIFS